MLGEPRCYSAAPSPPLPSLPPPLTGVAGKADPLTSPPKLLGCVRVQLSRGRRKRGIKRAKRSEKTSGQVDRPRRRDPDTRRRHRGRTQGRAAMERSAEEDHKEKLLWNVKREVGEAMAFSASFTILMADLSY